ncbi:alpha/beta fold hydrolase BchO [Rhodovastum atsumiense]|uniref:Alpha/beta fold hydrolase n=1 Tax=Rhodovastum atsumiense TaxID=504468 RepID=A0A5M6IX51_9PROT|nr:alpha/beta fold hydrolase BchO [Rhodovastum atsumiense]KAA5612893.1 alpha/beta fold hydrolase [Rhodovastum atsumiense]
MADRPVWERDGRDWPNREASRFVRAGGLRWHVQELGQGPLLLLLHGTGAATHSWRGLAPLLARQFRVIAPDLPGHGFTEAPAPQRLSLPGMAGLVTELLHTLGAGPVVAAGHSAGAAILARMALDGHLPARLLVSLNGALLPLRGIPGHVFSPIARLLTATSLAPRLFAWRAANDRKVVEQLLRATGSNLEPVQVDFYRRLIRSPGHAAAGLAMMANWDLRPLERDLPRLAVPLVLVAAHNDRTIPASDAQRVQALLSSARVVPIPRLGHLAHEEDPEQIAALILRLATESGLLPAPHTESSHA